jgi:hypothetical protein
MSASAFPFNLDSSLTGVTAVDGAFAPSLPASGNAVELFFARTDLGNAEVRQPLCDLPRPVRELLFLVDGSNAVDQCIAEVHNARLADAMVLLTLGLIRTTSFDAKTPSRAGRLPLRPLIDTLLDLTPEDLYTLLTQQAKLRLGLLQGFRMVLALERCEGHHEQRALAVRFVQEIWRTHGQAGISPLRKLLKV